MPFWHRPYWTSRCLMEKRGTQIRTINTRDCRGMKALLNAIGFKLSSEGVEADPKEVGCFRLVLAQLIIDL
jgi:hypothetical protein